MAEVGFNSCTHLVWENLSECVVGTRRGSIFTKVFSCQRLANGQEYDEKLSRVQNRQETGKQNKNRNRNRLGAKPKRRLKESDRDLTMTPVGFIDGRILGIKDRRSQ